MTTFETGKIYYRGCLRIQRFIIKRRTRCYVWFNELGRTMIIKKKIRYHLYGNEYFRSVETYNDAELVVSSDLWNSSWKLGKDEDNYDIIIKPDYKKYEKMNTATFKMFKYITNGWAKGRLSYYENGIIDYEYLVKEMVEDNPDDYDKDYYCLYYTCNKDINWDMINILMCRNYRIIQKY